MGIWDEADNIDDINELDDKELNPYLINKEKGFDLITILLPHKHQWNEQEKAAHILNYLLNNDLKNLLSFLNNIDSSEIGNKLQRIGNQLIEYKKIRMLRGKSIIGIGGAFSAGKSAFINSMLKEEGEDILLPENQTPTTSISTYVLNGKDDILACKKDGSILSLDISAMQAMTHEFYENYGIGFSRFVQNLAISTARFPDNLNERIAFLDTPGYSKSDDNTVENLQDANTAKNHLNTVDFLIWLISAESGTIQEGDIEFLRELNIDTPILIVFNKADKISKESCQDIIILAKQLLKDKINLFEITAYSAREKQEYFGTNHIQKFLEMASRKSEQKQNIDDILLNILDNIKKFFNKEINILFEDQKELGDNIFRAEDFLSLNSLVEQYYSISIRLKRIKKAYIDFINLQKKVQKQIQILFNTERLV